MLAGEVVAQRGGLAVGEDERVGRPSASRVMEVAWPSASTMRLGRPSASYWVVRAADVGAGFGGGVALGVAGVGGGDALEVLGLGDGVQRVVGEVAVASAASVMACTRRRPSRPYGCSGSGRWWRVTSSPLAS